VNVVAAPPQCSIPDEAAYPAMPPAAISAGVVDEVLRVSGLVELVTHLADGPGPIQPATERPVTDVSAGDRS
jgi:hypothetical protein